MRRLLLIPRFALSWLVTFLMGAVALALALPLGPDRTWVLLARRWSEAMLLINGIRLDVRGQEHLAAPAVYVLNHLSFSDALFTLALLPRTIRFVMKRELGNIPLFGWAMRFTGALLIDRGKTQEAIQRIEEGVRHLPPGWSLGVFPEGTRSPDGELQRFKKGAFYAALATRLPVIPVGTAGPLDIIPRGGMLARPGVVHVTAGPPISTGDWTYESIDQHVEEVRAAVARCIAESQARRGARLAE